MAKGQRVYLSPRRLSLFLECKRCFFEEVFMKQKRPRGAYPTLPGAIDEAMKRFTDDLRAKGEMPIQLKAFVGAHQLLSDQRAINRMRYWKEGLSTTVERTRQYGNEHVTHSLYIQGSVDELFVNPDDDTFAVPDFKTRKDKPVENYSERYYQTSMDTYAFLLEEMGLHPNGQCFLWYLWPKVVTSVDEYTLNIEFGSTVQTLTLDPNRVHKILDDIADTIPKSIILQKYIDEKLPNYNPDCEYCNYRRQGV